ncbi:metal-dependent hydrolase [uncultured Neptuniibacter sp.]|uniref:metal-dependent hydrolase n=1 Tax=uncultured Neptuniibacter sp. TaxID=502143 RepID=UPI0026057857|nr:metal-dependent hydrolase [uncultured Neptuniibacter sp.]
MDSVTQIALGAAVGQAVLGQKVGYRAALWGGIVATIPDLDVFISMGGAVADFTYHRSFSHSLFVLSLLAPLLAWLINRFHGQYEGLSKHWFMLVWLALVTHPILDSFTIYGTQLFWPLSVEPVGIGSIFIIDPLYTLPLLLGTLLALSARQAKWGLRANQLGIAISCLYLAWGVIAQNWVTEIAKENLAEKQSQSQVLVSAAPFNTLLWRVLVMKEHSYEEGFYSLLDPDRQIHFKEYPNQISQLGEIEQHWPVQRLQWFSKGFLKVKEQNRELLLSDLRMGAEPFYVFTFKVAEIDNGRVIPSEDQRIEEVRSEELVPNLLARIVSRGAL